MSQSSDTDTESVNNSNVEFFSPPPTKSDDIVTVDPDNIPFTIHRRGFITCVCGKVVRKHSCTILNLFKDLKIKFDLCPNKETCRFCEDIVQWNYERYMSKENDDKMYCRQCTKEIESDKGICHGCFCSVCYGFLDDCVCCKICPPNNQCLCDDDNLVSSLEEENLT